jgi:hypothetical protein
VVLGVDGVVDDALEVGAVGNVFMRLLNIFAVSRVESCRRG